MAMQYIRQGTLRIPEAARNDGCIIGGKKSWLCHGCQWILGLPLVAGSDGCALGGKK